MIKRYTKSINFDLYLNAAKKFKIKFVPLVEERPVGYFEKDGKKLYVSHNIIGINNCTSFLFAKNKFVSYQILKAKGIPCPKALLMKKKEGINDIEDRLKEIPKPWVVKPLSGSEGKGVSVGVKGKKRLQKAVNFARTQHKKVIIEEFIKGKHYRILVFRGKILDIVNRIPAHVTGDGESSISQLIKPKNKKRKEIGVKPIRDDQELRRQLTEQDLSLNSKPQKNEVIFLRKNCNLCAGGETKRIPLEEVHPDNVEMFKKCVQSLGLELGGIDFITPDITKSYKEIKCIINEVNKAPMGDAHYFADMEMDNRTSEKILRGYFSS